MIAVDTEASYSKELSIGTHGTRGYVEHPDTDHFMCSIYDRDSGLSYVGPPKDAPWDLVRGQEVCAHNYSYDRAVLREYERRGFIPFPLDEKGFCTANLAVYLQAPRSLAGAAQELLGTKVSKEARDKFKGKSYHDLSPEVQQEIRDYALTDAKLCWHLWKQFGHLMPEPEVRLSAHTTMMGARGIAVDMEAVEAGISTYKQLLWEISKEIPWSESNPITSPIQLKAHCRAAGIPVPESTAVTDEKFQLWAAEYSTTVPFVAAVQRYRSVNRALTVLEAMKVRTHAGRVRYGLKYFGANHTGRWSGDSGLNVQNLPRDPLEGVALRPCLQAAPGKALIVADYSQIEARVSVWYAEDKKQLALIRNGMCVYESHARSTLGFNSERTLKEEAKDNPAMFKLRQYAKARCLSADTLVLTQRGYVPIVKVKLDDRLWDGIEWVCHEGITQSGTKTTLTVNGDRFTPEHLLFTSDTGSTEASNYARGEAPAVDRFRQQVSSWNDVWSLAVAVQRVCARAGIHAITLPLHFLWGRAHCLYRHFVQGNLNPMRVLWGQAGKGNPRLSQVGPCPRRTGLMPSAAVERDNPPLLQPPVQAVPPLRG